MCGIAGIVTKRENKKEIIEAMSKRIEHRGPDGEGYFFDGDVALAAAIDTAKIAFAPKFDLSAVPSALIIALSTAYVSEASNPMIASLIFVLIFSTAFVTPFPKYLSLSPSLNSSASNSPVDAPLGAVPLATVPSTNVISASTVGFPLESRISLPTTFSISK